jgi:predicted O-linked N-acetylglucosamine transferase (SPINDLY family)
MAPLQFATWGHSVTSGIDTVDYYVSSDMVETPASEANYTEKLMRLPGYFLPRYRRPQLQGARKSRDELGLPANKHLYVCPQSPFKLHPDFDAALRGILERDPDGEIALLGGSRESWSARLRARFARTLGPSAARIRFLPPASPRDFLQYLASADVIIDPFYFGGCNTSAEALSLGAPIVTLPSFHLPGRFTLGLYRELQMDACLADSPAQFVDLAVRLGTDADHRRAISAQISERCERLFDRPDTGRALGAELQRIADAAR